MIWSLFASGAIPGDLAVQLTSTPGGVLALSALIAVVALALALRQATRAGVVRRGTPIAVVAERDTGHGPLVMAQTDPDAARRPRPRAPSRRVCFQ